MTRGLEHASYSLPEWWADKLTFFTPCVELMTHVMQNLIMKLGLTF